MHTFNFKIFQKFSLKKTNFVTNREIQIILSHNECSINSNIHLPPFKLDTADNPNIVEATTRTEHIHLTNINIYKEKGHDEDEQTFQPSGIP